jgi:trans-2,3-dihydro-3-hydroxyanthranilate isomerase
MRHPSSFIDAIADCLPFVQLDVFTTCPLEGNPLAVFPDARGLSDQRMQAIAREMNLSESTFIFPREAGLDRERGTRRSLLHPDRRVALCRSSHLGYGVRSARQKEEPAHSTRAQGRHGAGPLRRSPGVASFAEMAQPDPLFGKVHPAREDLGDDRNSPGENIHFELPIQTVSTRVPFIIVPLAQPSRGCPCLPQPQTGLGLSRKIARKVLLLRDVRDSAAVPRLGWSSMALSNPRIIS